MMPRAPSQTRCTCTHACPQTTAQSYRSGLFSPWACLRALCWSGFTTRLCSSWPHWWVTGLLRKVHELRAFQACGLHQEYTVTACAADIPRTTRVAGLRGVRTTLPSRAIEQRERTCRRHVCRSHARCSGDSEPPPAADRIRCASPGLQRCERCKSASVNPPAKGATVCVCTRLDTLCPIGRAQLRTLRPQVVSVEDPRAVFAGNWGRSSEAQAWSRYEETPRPGLEALPRYEGSVDVGCNRDAGPAYDRVLRCGQCRTRAPQRANTHDDRPRSVGDAMRFEPLDRGGGLKQQCTYQSAHTDVLENKHLKANVAPVGPRGRPDSQRQGDQVSPNPLTTEHARSEKETVQGRSRRHEVNGWRWRDVFDHRGCRRDHG